MVLYDPQSLLQEDGNGFLIPSPHLCFLGTVTEHFGGFLGTLYRILLVKSQHPGQIQCFLSTLDRVLRDSFSTVIFGVQDILL